MPPACHWPAPLPRPLRAAHWLVLRARPSPAVSGWPPAALPAHRLPLAPFPAIPLAIGQHHRLAWPMPSNVALGKSRRTALRMRAATGAWWILTGPRAPRDQPGTRGAARLGPVRFWRASLVPPLDTAFPSGSRQQRYPPRSCRSVPGAGLRPGRAPARFRFASSSPVTETGRARRSPVAVAGQTPPLGSACAAPALPRVPAAGARRAGKGPGRCPCPAPGAAAPAHAGPELGRAAGSRPRPGDRQPGAAQSRCCSVLRARAAPGARRFPYGTGVPRVLPGAAARSLLRPVLNHALLSAPGRVQRGLGRQS